MEFLFVLFFFLVIAVYAHRGANVKAKVSEKLQRDRVKPLQLTVNWFKGSRYDTYVDFTGTTTDTNEPVGGHAVVSSMSRNVMLVYSRGPDWATRMRRLSAAEPAVASEELDLDARIQFQTNQRLEALQGDRDAFLANDTDGDGMVDAEEWAAVRQRIEAEVRLELGDVEPGEVEPDESEQPAVEPPSKKDAAVAVEPPPVDPPAGEIDPSNLQPEADDDVAPGDDWW